MGTCHSPMHICRHQASVRASPGARWTHWTDSILPSPTPRQLGHRHGGGEEEGSAPSLSANNFIHAPGGFYTFS